ncbi:MAG: NAD(P)-dependent oxidoreductase [Planctomycetota bacterium]
MKLAVTGATGFVGSHFLNEALTHRQEVLALRRIGSRPRIGLFSEPEWVEGGVDAFHEGNLTGVDCLVHLAAHGVDPSRANWEDTFRVNVNDSLGLWLRAARAGVRNFIVIGSCFEYGSYGEKYDFIPEDAPLRPTGPYHASKAAATMAAAAFSATEKVNVWVLRPFQIYGAGESINRLYPQILEAAHHGKDLRLTEGNQIRDFMDVREVARMIHGYALLLVDKKETPFFKTTNLGTGKPTTLREFTERIWREENGTGKLEFGALPYRVGEVMRYVPCIDAEEQLQVRNALDAVRVKNGL